MSTKKEGLRPLLLYSRIIIPPVTYINAVKHDCLD